MVQSVREMRGTTIQGADGDIGQLIEFLFDDQQWTIRYLVVDTGGWFSGRRLLLSPISIVRADWNAKTITVGLPRRHVERSPAIHTAEPVSRQLERELAQYYGYAPYWDGSSIWGAGVSPALLRYAGSLRPALHVPTVSTSEADPSRDARSPEQGAAHLRSTRQVRGFQVEARDGAIGQVDDMLVDEGTWVLWYLVIAIGSWRTGKQVLIPPDWITTMAWTHNAIHVDLPRATITAAPEFDPYARVSREHELRLAAYYGQPTNRRGSLPLLDD